MNKSIIYNTIHTFFSFFLLKNALYGAWFKSSFEILDFLTRFTVINSLGQNSFFIPHFPRHFFNLDNRDWRQKLRTLEYKK